MAASLYDSLGCRVRASYRKPEGKVVAIDSAKARINDYFVNAAARSGWGTPSLTEATEYELVRLSYDYWLMITLYQNHWICGKIVDIPAGDMIKAWPRITSEIDPKDITRVDACIRKTQIKGQLEKCIQWSRLFGGAGALIVIDGQESMLDEPLDLESIEIGGFRGLIPFDRWSGIYPSGELCTDIRKPTQFNLPQYYEVMNQNGGGRFRVHSSRILRFTGPNVPQPEYQAMMYWGISVYERIYEELRKRDNMSWNILNLTYRANLIAMQEPQLAQMLSGLGMNQNALIQYQARMQAMNQSLSNQNMLFLPKDSTMSAVNYGFSGVSDVYQQFQLDIAGAAEIPVTRLYGRTLSGLGQSNDADERIYEEKIALDQDRGLRPQLEILYPVICMSVMGEVPEDIDLRFPSIRVLDDKEKSDLAKSTGDTINGYFNTGLYTKPMAMKDIKQTSDVTGIGTNITDEDIAAAEEEAETMPQLPQGETGEEPTASPTNAERMARAGKPKDADTPERATDALTARQFAGMPITIEYRAGERRTIRNADGDVVYDRTMKHDYGYLDGTTGRDGDEIDVIVGPDESANAVYVCDMRDLGPDVDKREDEDKVCLGFTSESDARNAFLAMYPPSFLADVETIPLETFKEQLDAGVFAGSMATDGEQHWRTVGGQHVLFSGSEKQIGGNPEVMGKAAKTSAPNPKGKHPSSTAASANSSASMKRLTPQENKALRNYQGAAPAMLNQVARGDLSNIHSEEQLADTKRRIADLDSAISKSTLNESVTTYRGISHSLEGDLSDLVGKTIPSGGFQSTSTSIKTAQKFSGNGTHSAILQIQLEKGQHAVDFNQVEGAREDLGESEILLPRNTQFEVVKVKAGKVPVITVRAIQSSAGKTGDAIFDWEEDSWHDNHNRSHQGER